jgi:hypothetical protein
MTSSSVLSPTESTAPARLTVLDLGSTEPELVTPAEPEVEAVPRHFTAWDVVGLLVAAWVMLIVNRIGVGVMDTPLGHSRSIDALTIAVMAAAAGTLGLMVAWDRPSPSLVLRSLVAVWRDPPRPAVAFLLGGLLAVPLLGLYYPALFSDSDSARLVASIRYVQHGHLQYFADTQENFLPHLLLGPIQAMAGLPGLRIAAVVSVMVLAGVVAYVTYRLTGSMWAAGAAALALLCLAGVDERASKLPMYPTMLALGYLGGWLCYRAYTEPLSRWRYAIPGGLCIALAQEAHGVGQLFLAVPLMVAVFAPNWRLGLNQLLRILVAMAAVLVPRLVVNLSEGGLTAVESFRSDYWITQGHLVQIQNRFWFYEGVSEPVRDYLHLLPGRFFSTLGVPGAVVAVAAVLAWSVACRGRARLFVLGAGAFFLLAITVKPVPSFPRYYSPVWPGIALLVGAFVAGLVRERRWALLTAVSRGLAVLVSVGLVVGAAVSYRGAVQKSDSQRLVMEGAPYRELAAAIDDGKGVIGARAHVVLLSVTSDIPTWGDQFLTEREYVTYLTWPSDAAVIDMMERHDIGWALVNAQVPLETLYNNTWLKPRYQDTARHVTALAQSPDFCRYLTIAGFVLYKLGPCPDSYPG